MAQARTTSHSDANRAAREATIGGGTRVRGKITGDGNLLVEGSVEGEIALRGDLTIREGGSVTSDVEAHAITILGSLEGDVLASGNVHISAGARVRGDVKGAEVAIDEGAEFAGRLDCDFQLPAELESKTASGRR
jgi:cytoskeletal protein CcmA (bactofilin family)